MGENNDLPEDVILALASALKKLGLNEVIFSKSSTICKLFESKFEELEQQIRDKDCPWKMYRRYGIEFFFIDMNQSPQNLICIQQK